jgi:hypothetical protein
LGGHNQGITRDLRIAKKAGSKLLSSQLDVFLILCQLITDDSIDGDDGGGNNSGARRTNRMKAHNSSHSTDTAGNTGNNIQKDNTRSSPEIRTLFRPKRQRQNAARERKSVPPPPMQLREVFS